MLHQIDPHSGVPVYRQLMDQIRFCVASGLLKPNDLLPSIRDLSRQLSINPTTVVKAYSELEHEGVIQIRHGKGAFVAASARAISDAQRARLLARAARQLAVEAIQLNASDDLALEALKHELEAIRHDRRGD